MIDLKVKNQYTKISLIYQFILEIQQILESHERKRTHPFLTRPTRKLFKVTISFPEFVSACRKIGSIHQFPLEIQQTLESCDLKSRDLTNHHTQLPYNVIFPTETNLSIRSRYVFYFVFCLN